MRIISSMRILALVSLLLIEAQHVLSQDEQPMPKNETLAVTGSGGAAYDECGLEVKVGCILAHTADDENPLDCNAYVPETLQNCTMQVRYTYRVDKDDKLSGMKLVSALRYREGSYWESQFGNPRPFSGSRWDTLLTVKGGYYRMDQWEGEYVNFCQPQSVSTLFEFNVDGIDSAGDACSRSDSYTLTTTGGESETMQQQEQAQAGDNGMAHGSSGAGTATASASVAESFQCPLEIELTCMIDTDGDGEGDVDCNDYDPISSGLPCDAKTIYAHKLHNKAPWNSGIDSNFIEVSRTREGDLPHGDFYDFLDKVLGGSFLLEAMYQTTIREIPTINFCQPVQDIYVTTFHTISTTDGGTTTCENKAEYILDMINRRR